MELVDHVAGHRGVDLAGELDEAGPARRPRVRAMLSRMDPLEYSDPPVLGPGLKRMKPKGLVSAASSTSQTSMSEAVVDDLELVDEGDVDGAEDVLGELGGLGDAGGGDADGAVDDLIVEGLGEVAGDGVDAADYFGNIRCTERWGCRGLRAQGLKARKKCSRTHERVLSFEF